MKSLIQHLKYVSAGIAAPAIALSICAVALAVIYALAAWPLTTGSILIISACYLLCRIIMEEK